MDDIIAAARAAVGRELPPHRWVVEEGQVRQFCRAIRVNDLDQAVNDEVPVAYTVTAALWGTPHHELLLSLGLDLGRIVHGEQQFEIVEPLKLGEEYTVRHRVADVTVKSGRRAGRMIVVVVETTIEDNSGALRARELHTSIQTER